MGFSSIALYNVVGSSNSSVNLPFSSSGSQSYRCSGTCPFVTVDTFQLVAMGGNYTITGLSAVNNTNGSSVIASFSGLTNNQVISNGQPVTFNLRSSYTRGSTVNLRYSFTIVETQQTFTYDVSLTSN